MIVKVLALSLLALRDNLYLNSLGNYIDKSELFLFITIVTSRVPF